MRSRAILLGLTISAVVAVGLFVPNFTYAGQMASNPVGLTPLASNVSSTAPATTVRGHGGWHGAARAFRGGPGFGEFYGGFNAYPYDYEYDDYYVAPSCNTVWDPDLNEWVCGDTYYYSY